MCCTAAEYNTITMDSVCKTAHVKLVDRPTQLIYIWIFICQHTSTKDIAGQSANLLAAG